MSEEGQKKIRKNTRRMSFELKTPHALQNVICSKCFHFDYE